VQISGLFPMQFRLVSSPSHVASRLEKLLATSLTIQFTVSEVDRVSQKSGPRRIAAGAAGAAVVAVVAGAAGILIRKVVAARQSIIQPIQRPLTNLIPFWKIHQLLSDCLVETHTPGHTQAHINI